MLPENRAATVPLGGGGAIHDPTFADAQQPMTSTGRPYLRRVLVGTAAATVANLWTVVLGVITLPILVHSLGTADFGVFSLLQVWNGTTGYLSIASVGAGVVGLRLVASRAASGDAAATASAVGALLAVGCCIGATGGLLFALAGPPLFEVLLGSRPEEFTAIARWFGASLIAEQVALAMQYCAEGFQRVAVSRGSDAVRRTLTLGAATTGAVMTGRLDVAVATSALAALAWAGVLVVAVVTGAGNHPRPARPRREDVTTLLRSGSEVAGLTAVGVAHRSMDRLLAAWLFGPASVGIVEIATQVQNAASAVLSSSSYVATASAPWLETRQAKSQQRQLLLRGSRLVVLATVPVVLLLGFLADSLLAVWLGGAGTRAASLVPLALVYIGVAAPLQVPSNMLLGTGRVRRIVQAALPSLMVNLVASVVLSQVLGLAGLFWGTLVGTVTLGPLLFRAAQTMVPVALGDFLRQAVLPALLPTTALSFVLAAVVMTPFSDVVTLLLGGILGVPSYLVVALRWSVDRDQVVDLLGSLRPPPVAGDGEHT